MMENYFGPLCAGKPEKTKCGLRPEVQLALLSFLWVKSLKIKQRQQVLTQASVLFSGTDNTPFNGREVGQKVNWELPLSCPRFFCINTRAYFLFLSISLAQSVLWFLLPPPGVRACRAAKVPSASSVNWPLHHGTQCLPLWVQVIPSTGVGILLSLSVLRLNLCPKPLWIFFLISGSFYEWYHLGGNTLILMEDSFVKGGCRFWGKAHISAHMALAVLIC